MALKILVTAKRVEDPESRIQVTPDGTGIVTDGVSYRLNPFDEVAIEEAVRLREKHGGEVVVASIGRENCGPEIRTALAMGADRAILVKHDSALDPVLVAAILSKIVELETPDLVLLGKQSIDDDQGQIGQYLAEILGVGQAACASRLGGLESEAEQKREPGLVLSADGRELSVLREVDGGFERLEVVLPGVVTTDLRLNKPRFVTLPGMMKAKKKPLRVMDASEFGLDLHPKVILKRYFEPKKRKAGIRVASVDELWTKLHGEEKVL